MNLVFCTFQTYLRTHTDGTYYRCDEDGDATGSPLTSGEVEDTVMNHSLEYVLALEGSGTVQLYRATIHSTVPTHADSGHGIPFLVMYP